MSSASYKKIDYSLRVAKNIERKMLAEGLLRLSRVADLSDYRYVGFGSTFFSDFNIFHRVLGIQEMISIEKEIIDEDRFKLNRPYRCVKLKLGESQAVLPTLTWKKRNIVWLDYDGELNQTVLDDIQCVVSSVRSGSALIITVNAHPDVISSNSDDDLSAPEYRLKQLTERIGQTKIPLIPDIKQKGERKVKGTDLSGWGKANVLRHVISNHINDVLNARCAPLNKNHKQSFLQLFNFQYADGAKMLTFGGVFLNSSDKNKLGSDTFAGLDYVLHDEGEYRIDPPVLTLRERRYLNQKVPVQTMSLKLPTWLKENERKKYLDLYRYFPSFTEAEL